MRQFRPLALLVLSLHGSMASALVEKKPEQPVRGVFYEVSGQATHPAKSKVYLLGSIHVANDSLYPLPDRIEQAFKSSPVLVVEADLGEDRAGAAAALMAAGIYPAGGGQSLRTAVSPQCYAEVSQAAKEAGISLDRLDLMKPWMAAILFEGVIAAKAGLDPKKGIDMHFLNAARGAKTIVELEGLQEQLNLFDGLPADQQTALLYFTVKERRSFKSDLDRLLKAWRSGDTAALEEIIHQSEKEAPELKSSMDALLKNRNKTMTEEIAGYLGKPGDHFVVVGAAHLVGADGIAAQLQAKGFTVTRY